MFEREQFIRANLTDIQERIARAARRSSREISEISLISVTKTFPVTDVGVLASLGEHNVGENRVDELRLKRAEYEEIRQGAEDGSKQRLPAVTWHMVGQVQSKKAGAVARAADVVHSVDREKLIQALNRGAERNDRGLDVLLQVKTDDDPARAGVAAKDLFYLAEKVAETEFLHLRGVMAMAPKSGDPEPTFARLQALSGDLRREHPQANWISAGMSGDFETAIAYGATHVRVGRGLLGSRPNLG